MRLRPVPLLWVAAIAAGTAASALLLGGGVLNYDVIWSLDWGAALTRGETPDITADGAPTSHPLATAIAALAQLVVGDAAPDVLRGLTHLAFAGFVAAAAAVAARISGPPAGIVAALVLVLSSPVQMNTALTFQDVAAGALILTAVLLELRRPRHGTAALLVLGAAGLLRPEAWGLAGAYWLYLALGTDSNARRAQLAALAAIGPGLWMLSDLVLTGEPFLSFTRTREGAEAARRETGITEGPRLLVDNMRSTLGASVLLSAALAALAAVASLRRETPLADRRLLLATGVAALLCIAFLALATGELSLLERYVIPLAGATAVLAGHGAGGFLRAGGRLRLGWAAFGAAVVAATIATAPGEIDRTQLEIGTAWDRQELVEQLGALDIPQGCTTLAVANYRFRPYLAYEVDERAGDLPIAEDPARLQGPVAWVAPGTPHADENFGPIFGGRTALPQTGFRRAPGTADWAVFTRGC